VTVLNYPSDWFIDAATLDAVKGSLPTLLKFYEEDGLEDMGVLPILDLVKEPLKECYTIPLFSEEFCKLLLQLVKNHTFKPNDDEDGLRQIPEIILSEQLPELYTSMMCITKAVIEPILSSLWGCHIHSAHIQVANYNPRDKKQGAWHHDITSDITIVVPLNTGEYTGGGTEFMRRGVVEPLPNGSALMFPSLTHMHRGLPVSEGDRYLLVFWLKCGDANEK